MCMREVQHVVTHRCQEPQRDDDEAKSSDYQCRYSRNARHQVGIIWLRFDWHSCMLPSCVKQQDADVAVKATTYGIIALAVQLRVAPYVPNMKCLRTTRADCSLAPR